MSIKRTTLILLGLLSTLAASPIQAAFITDKIVVEIHAERFNQGPVLKSLSSGSRVELLMSDGEFSRVRTADNVTGWVESKYLSNEKPTQLEYLELLAKSKGLEARLKSAEEQLAQGAPASGGMNEEELAELQQRAKDAGWMRVELKKARDQAIALEQKLKAVKSNKADSQSALDELQAKNADLEQRLAAALLVNEQHEAEPDAIQVAAAPMEHNGANPVAAPNEDSGASVAIGWFLGSIVIALIAGAIGGMLWLDKRIRERHGGFRIY